MFSVALIGPDGAGKTTIGRRLEQTSALRLKYIYMGVNGEASNYALPTTRLIHTIKRLRGAAPDVGGPPDPARSRPRPRGLARRAAASIKSSLRLLNRIAEEWFRQALAWYYQRRGYVVLFDRHFFSDYYAYDIAHAGQPVSRRLHGLMLSYLYPKPDLVIYLDAPAHVLLARKGEGTLESLARRRHDYLRMRDLVPHFSVVDATKPLDEVAGTVSTLIADFPNVRTDMSMKVRNGSV
jgi:thymidylate kinase